MVVSWTEVDRSSGPGRAGGRTRPTGSADGRGRAHAHACARGVGACTGSDVTGEAGRGRRVATGVRTRQGNRTPFLRFDRAGLGWLARQRAAPRERPGHQAGRTTRAAWARAGDES